MRQRISRRHGPFALPRRMQTGLPSGQDDITTEHFHRPVVQRTGQPARTPANQNLLSPHRQNRLDLNHHEAPLHDRKKGGGHVLLKHVDPTEAYIERRFTKCSRITAPGLMAGSRTPEMEIKSSLTDILLEGGLSLSRMPIGSARLRDVCALQLSKKNTME